MLGDRYKLHRLIGIIHSVKGGYERPTKETFFNYIGLTYRLLCSPCTSPCKPYAAPLVDHT
jgi:hypothetical protein